MALQSFNIFGSEVLLVQKAEKVQNECKTCPAAAPCGVSVYALHAAALSLNSHRIKRFFQGSLPLPTLARQGDVELTDFSFDIQSWMK